MIFCMLKGSFLFLKMSSFSETEKTFLKCRYLVAVIGFAVFLLLNCHRMNMSVAIVTMVNTSANTMSDMLQNDTKASNNVSQDQKEESKFYWNPTVQGYILGSSFLGYFMTLAIGGKLAEVFGAKRLLFSGMFISSMSTMLSPFAAVWNVNALITIQFVRGFGQGFLQGSVTVLMANWFPRPERGVLSSFVFSGFSTGTVLGASISGYLCKYSSLGGWPMVFYVFGGAGLAFSILLLIFLHEMPKDHPRISKSELMFILKNQELELTSKRPRVPWIKILSSLPVYALIIGIFGQFWLGTYFILLFPTFLSTVLGYSAEQSGTLTSLPFIIQYLLTFTSGWISNWMNKRNCLSLNQVRKGCNFLSCIGFSACTIIIIISKYEKTTSVVSSVIAIAMMGLGFSGCYIVPGDMSPTFAGSLMGISCTFGATSGFILPVLAGALLNEDNSTAAWTKFFIISVAIVFSSGVFFSLFGSAEVQDWNFPDKEESSNSQTVEDIVFTMDKNSECSVQL